MKRIKLVDLAMQNAEIQAEVELAFAGIHRTTSYVGGPEVESFEREFADYLGVRHVVGVSSGTDALRLALLAVGIGEGDEVITTPMSFIGTVEGIVQTGAAPSFVDVDPVSGNMCPAALRNYLESGPYRTRNGPKAVLPVHLYGAPAPMSELIAIAQDYRIQVIEDACQAHGAKVALADRWVHAGTVGEAGCFSFYPGKNLGAWGEAGAVATDNSDLAAQIISLRDHGRISHYAHERCGYNARLDTLQAAVLRAKLKCLDRWNDRRREIAQLYRELLSDLPIELPEEAGDADPCYHLYVIKSRIRDSLRSALLTNQIECGIHYPVPLHLQPALRSYGYRRGDFPLAECVADTVLSLPMHPHLTDVDVARVAEVIHAEFAKARGAVDGAHPDLGASESPSGNA